MSSMNEFEGLRPSLLDERQQALWAQLKNSLTREQSIWFAGYVQGLAHGQMGDGAPAFTAQVAQKMRIYFATETGNSKMVAQQLAKEAKHKGWQAQVLAIKKTNAKELSALTEPAIFVVSTHGDGDPPAAAVHFFEQLRAATDSLASLSYAVLGLGDSSYPFFCKTAADLDGLLQERGAKAFHARRDLDVDYNAQVPGWIKSLVAALPSQQVAPTLAGDPLQFTEPMPTSIGYSRLEPVKGTITETINLNDHGSNKETYHIEFEHDSGVSYSPGDAAGIIIPNQPGEEPIAPRLYSIASSPLAHGNSIHLTVSLAWHDLPDGSRGYGVCSHYLAGLKAGDEIEFYIQRNHLFKLPEDDRDIIMIGPGTGIAPFRSFVHERVGRAASGRNWLFFGEQYAHCDFLYQAEWLEQLETEGLQRIDVAFSRDQAEKIYVQHRLREKADDVYEWLQNGAAIYVCGDKERMSKDVERALVEIIAERNHGSEKAALEYLDQLQDENRYLKDVY